MSRALRKLPAFTPSPVRKMAVALKVVERDGLSIEEIFKSLFWDVVVSAALKQLFAAVPFLAWGPVGWLVEIIVRYVGDWIYEGVDEYIDLQVIAFKKLEHAREYARLTVNLKNVALTNGVNSPEFIDARKAAILAMRQFVKFNG